MTKLWGVGERIPVEVDVSGLPTRFTRKQKQYVVENVVQFWRIETNWWNSRISKEYFQVITVSGALVIIVHDSIADTWEWYRLYD